MILVWVPSRYRNFWALTHHQAGLHHRAAVRMSLTSHAFAGLGMRPYSVESKRNRYDVEARAIYLPSVTPKMKNVW